MAAIKQRKTKYSVIYWYVNEQGDVEAVCEGTMLGDNSEHYRNRKALTGDLHGQAPVLWCAYALLAK